MLRRLAAEGVGTALLLAVVVGSGIMAERLAGGNGALALLANTIATGAGLYVLITVFGPVSGAHFNPSVSLAFLLRGEMGAATALAYVGVQIVGALAGVWLAHAMFAEPLLQISSTPRDGPALALSEFVATFGLVLTVLAVREHRPEAVAAAVALYITAAYWFTASTSFANPAVTLGRALSDTFAGVAPSSVPAFVVAQVAGAIAATLLFQPLFAPRAQA